MSADAFFEGLERKVPPIIAIGGPARTLVDESTELVRQKVLAGAIVDFNHDRVSAKDHSAEDVVNLANCLPTMAARRLVEVHDAEQLEFTPRLDAFLKSPPQESCLLLVFGQLDVRKKLPKTLQKLAPEIARFAKFDHPKEREMSRLAARRAKRRGLKLPGDAAEILAMTIGPDLGLLERALEKLELVVDGQEITKEIVVEHVADTHSEDAFRFGRAVLTGDRAAALECLAQLEKERAAPIQLVGLLSWQLRQAVSARSILDEGGSPDDVRKQLRLFGDRASAVLGAARRFNSSQHRRRLLRVGDVDSELKSSRASAWSWLNRLALELCPAPRAAKRDGPSARA